jgi:hypothetical protein
MAKWHLNPCGPALYILVHRRNWRANDYRDGWEENGVFLYTGGGQVDDQQFTHGNRAIGAIVNTPPCKHKKTPLE